MNTNRSFDAKHYTEASFYLSALERGCRICGHRYAAASCLKKVHTLSLLWPCGLRQLHGSQVEYAGCWQANTGWTCAM